MVKIMRLNMVYLKITNLTLQACVMNYDYIKSTNYIINALFLYNNTIKMIHESDPYYYPTKKPTEIILMDKEKFKKVVENKEFFQKHVQFLNEQLNFTNSNLKELWLRVNDKKVHSSNKTLYNMIRDIIETIEKVPVYNTWNYVKVLNKYTMLPSLGGEWPNLIPAG